MLLKNLGGTDFVGSLGTNIELEFLEWCKLRNGFILLGLSVLEVESFLDWGAQLNVPIYGIWWQFLE